LGFDPVPGNPAAVAAASERCGAVASTAGATEPVLREALALSGTQWTGEAAQVFGARLEHAPRELTSARNVLRAAAEMLDEWAGTLLANQRRADQLDRQAVTLRRAVVDAADEVDATSTVAQFSTGALGVGAAADHAAAVARYDQFQQELDKVIEDARTLERDHLAEARRVAERLRALAHGGVAAAAGVPNREELFGTLANRLNAFAELGGELGATLLGPPRARPDGEPWAIPPAAAAFAASVGMAGHGGSHE
jgi:hypothetical protein